MAKEDVCPVCRTPWHAPANAKEKELRITNMSNSDAYVVGCPRCGGFTITGSMLRMRRDTEPNWRVSGYLRHRHERGMPQLMISNYDGGDLVSFETIERFAPDPREVLDVQDSLLVTLSRLTEVGDLGTVDVNDTSLVFSGKAEALVFHLQELEGRGLLEATNTHPLMRYKLTGEGWIRAGELDRGTVERPDQGFIALWLSEELGEGREGLIAGVEGAGYRASLMGEREDFNEDVVAMILAEIRKSRFVVADFTGHRKSVYYEAGFAKGLGKPVILTCRETDFAKDQRQFDTEHEHYLVWQTGEELAERLKIRIEMSIGRPPDAGGDL